ncbi:MAG: PHB depolymerase family esterase [Blastocatellales bacterium]
MKRTMFSVSLICMVFIFLTSGFSQFADANIQQAPPRRSPQNDEEPGKRTFYLAIEGAMREFIIYRPAGLPANQNAPVVFAFHGTGGSGENFYQDSAWREKADAEGFMAVFPSARRYHIFDETLVRHGEVLTNVQRFTTKWNFFDLEKLLDPAYPNQTLYDDVKFVQVIVEVLKRNYAVDQERFYATGFSNGAQFTGRLAVQMSDVFAAFAICGNARSFNREQAALTNVYTNAPFKPRPVFQVIGELDPKLTYPAKVEAFPLDESAAAPGTFTKEVIINSWLGLLGLPDQYTYSRPNAASVFQYGAAGASPEYRFSIVEGMRHVYPNGENFRFEIADIFWPFMLQHRR